MTGGRKGTIAAIDLTRFICALLVVFHHYATMFAINSDSFLRRIAPDVALAPDWVGWSWPGWVGVELFFVISGYVIAMSAATSGPRDFLRRRVLRLVPAAWICATLTAIFLPLTGLFPIARILTDWTSSILFWPTRPQIDGSYWTLGIEVNFYLLVALQLGWRGGGLRAVERTGIALAALGAVYWLLRLGGVLAAADRTTDLSLLPYGGLFAAGIALAALRDRGVSGLRLATLTLGLASGVTEIWSEAEFFIRGLGLAAHPALPLTIFATGVAGIASADRLQPLLARVIGLRRIAFLGMTTYPLYLLHQSCGGMLIVVLSRAGIESHVAMVATACAMVILAAAITRFAEPGLRHALSALLSRRGPLRDIRPIAPSGSLAVMSTRPQT